MRHINDDAGDLPDIGDDLLLGSNHFSNWSADELRGPWSVGPGHQSVVGAPEADASYWVLQTTPFTCAVVSQQMILSQFGFQVSEAQLVYDATSHGWLHSGGTSPDDVGRLLEAYGVSCHSRQGADVESLLAELSRGHKVIAAVDCGELSKQDWFFEDWLVPGGADHAVVVTGIDMRNPNHPLVVLNDPGDAHGAGRVYPLDEFLDAWADSGQMYVATDHAPPDLPSHTVFGPHFDDDAGLYMDLGYWTAFLAKVLHDASSAARQFLHHTDLWSGTNTATSCRCPTLGRDLTTPHATLSSTPFSPARSRRLVRPACTSPHAPRHGNLPPCQTCNVLPRRSR